MCGAGLVIRLRRGEGWKQGFGRKVKPGLGSGLGGRLRVVGGALEGFETAAGFKAAAGTGGVSPWQIDPRPFLPQASPMCCSKTTTPVCRCRGNHKRALGSVGAWCRGRRRKLSFIRVGRVTG